MRIGVIGAGYVGLVTGVCLAEMGNHLTIADIDPRKISALEKGRSPHFEPGLEALLSENMRAGRLRFSTQTALAVQEQEIVFLAVGTPMNDDGSANLTHLYDAAQVVAKNLTARTVLIIKSTVPVGANAELTEKIRHHCQHEFAIVSNPEFLKEGAAVLDFMKPDRVVIGVREAWAEKIMRQLYSPFVRSGRPIMVMDPESAEMVKYASNALLASRISFMNEIANICAKVGADVELVRRGVGSDSRLGSAFLFPGLGYGGSCFPKDVRALVQIAKKSGVNAEICRAVDQTNSAQRGIFLSAIEREFSANLRDKKFAIWGLSFKPMTDDVREAPAIYLINELLKRGANISAYDPQGSNNAREELSDKITYAQTAYQALENADALIICTEWNEFRSPDFALLKQKLKRPLIFDGRNLYDLSALAEAGFTYYSIGRPTVR